MAIYTYAVMLVPYIYQPIDRLTTGRSTDILAHTRGSRSHPPTRTALEMCTSVSHTPPGPRQTCKPPLPCSRSP
ncbi:hypothetical protein HZ326_23021 [Fusarium oxysporum f. sp. albedinis]|nr:hypothetical protein HZ326_23021 [Fusarium oxysporum f. sp. albedinis]